MRIKSLKEIKEDILAFILFIGVTLFMLGMGYLIDLALIHFLGINVNIKH